MNVIGIDPGTHTGFAVWDVEAQRFDSLESLPLHRALERVRDLTLFRIAQTTPVIFEDARQRTWFGHSGREKLQGAGAAKRDAAIWQDFLEDHGIPYVARKPSAGSTKWPAEQFRRLTKWEPRTNEHARDAGVLVYGLRLGDALNIVRSWEQVRANTARAASSRR